eukprot:280646_1
MTDRMIEFSKSKTQTKSINKTGDETQRLRFKKDSNRFYSLSDHPSKCESKYAHSDNIIFILFFGIIEWIRWKINLILLFRPFAYLSLIENSKIRIPIWFIRLTLLELCFYIFFFYPILYWQYFEYGGKGSGNMAQYWYTCTWILGMRNNFIFSIFFGLSFERLIIFHQIVAIMSTILGCIHTWYNWQLRQPPSSRYSLFELPYAIYGTIGLICNFLIILTSLPYIRRKYFDSIFYKCHWILFILMSIFIGIHIYRVQ